jgi:hypothetical protein
VKLQTGRYSPAQGGHRETTLANQRQQGHLQASNVVSAQETSRVPRDLPLVRPHRMKIRSLAELNGGHRV